MTSVEFIPLMRGLHDSAVLDRIRGGADPILIYRRDCLVLQLSAATGYNSFTLGHIPKRDNIYYGYLVIMRCAALVFTAFLFLATQAHAGPLEEAQACGDIRAELKLLQPLADQGDPQAQYRLGQMYDLGTGVMRDPQEAVKWLTKAADQGNTDAETWLGGIYSRKIPKEVDDNGIPQDYSVALKWYRKAAEKGDAIAERQLGIMYEYGDGVKADGAEAAKWYLLAAQHGESSAPILLGRLYESGRGVKQDLVEAYMWMLVGHQEPEQLALISKNMNASQIAEAKRLAAGTKIKIKTKSSKPMWLTGNVVGLRMELDDPDRLEVMEFRDSGEVFTDIGSKHGPVAAPIFEWRIRAAGHDLEILDANNSVFEELGIVSRDAHTITACNKSRKLIRFKISQEPVLQR